MTSSVSGFWFWIYLLQHRLFHHPQDFSRAQRLVHSPQFSACPPQKKYHGGFYWFA